MDNIFKAFKKRLSVNSLSSITKFRDLVKTFAKFAVETSNQIKERQQTNLNQPGRNSFLNKGSIKNREKISKAFSKEKL